MWDQADKELIRRVRDFDAGIAELQERVAATRLLKAKTVFEFHRDTGRSYRDIAALLDVSLGQVQQLIGKGKEQT